MRAELAAAGRGLSLGWAALRRRAAGRGPFMLLLVAGFACLAHGLWIPSKALLAHGLLERSWSRTVTAGEPAPPWPWADTWPVARLRAPEHGVDQVVLEGASGSVLAFAPGRFQALDGLETDHGDHWVIAGHRDTHFRFLDRLQAGDALEIQGRDGSSRSYRVSWMRVVDYRDVDVLDTGDGLTLVTCWPFDAVVPGGPLRYVVRAEPEVRPGPDRV